MSEFARLTNAQLHAFAAAALERAHKAPRALSGTEEAPAVNPTCDAYARFGDEWCRAVEESRRRGLL